jgi:3-hydroxyisobutyrate dehydrogenase-like beta-hydroxyacid dehydrogenase
MELAMVGLGKMGANMAVRLLLNALEGDTTLFTRSDGIEAAWRHH